MIKYGILLFLKGMAMGAANVIPGVSGGTIAFITGIYEKFIDSLKAIDLKALRYLFKLEFRQFGRHINFSFLFILGLGILASLFSLGKLLDYLFAEFPVNVWSFFFGLIAVSIYSVGRTIKKWSFITVLWFIIGTGVAVSLALLNPASENSSTIYLLLCGVVAMASMILPGLSGSFVLILMGNYQLIMLRAVPNAQLDILIPVLLGSILGFLILSRVISFFLHRFHDQSISLLTGFILGSLLIIWPWKRENYLLDEMGNLILRNQEPVVTGYEWFIPSLTSPTFIAILLALAGVFVVLLIERTAVKR